MMRDFFLMKGLSIFWLINLLISLSYISFASHTVRTQTLKPFDGKRFITLEKDTLEKEYICDWKWMKCVPSSITGVMEARGHQFKGVQLLHDGLAKPFFIIY